MCRFFKSLAILAAAIPFVLAQGNTGVTTSSTERTFIAYGTSAPSSTKTIHVTKILDTTTLTTTSKVITTSPIRFTTIVSYTYLSTLNIASTFEPTTDVFTSNFTTTVYNIMNNTSTSYINVTTTAGSTLSTDSVVTIPTPSGFVPVDDSTGDYNYNKTASKRDAESREGRLLPRQAIASISNAPIISLVSIVTQLVPKTTSTVFVTSTKTSTQKPPATVTSSKTITVTNTVGVPDRPVNSTVIVTFSTTQNLTQLVIIPSETVVATVTTSQTNYTSTRTTYAACATDNLLGPQLEGGAYINKITDNDKTNLGMGTNATSSYQCCTICQNPAYPCDFAYFDTLATTNQCMLYKSAMGSNGSATCSHTQAGFFTTNKTTEDRWVVINGPCGQLVHGNPAKASTS